MLIPRPGKDFTDRPLKSYDSSSSGKSSRVHWTTCLTSPSTPGYGSLQRQDLLLWSLRQEGHIAAPHKYCRQMSSRPCDFLPVPFLFSQKVVGIKCIPTSVKMTSMQRISSKPGKILEPISDGTEHKMGPRDPGSCPLGITDLQRFLCDLKGRYTVHPSPLGERRPNSIYIPPATNPSQPTP